jgi:hypothetical protein
VASIFQTVQEVGATILTALKKKKCRHAFASKVENDDEGIRWHTPVAVDDE